MTILLVIIYVAFISLGLPDSLLGSAWPSIQADMHIPVAYAGMVSMIISIGTITSSLLSDRLTRRFGTGKVTACSVALTAVALMGFSVAPTFVWLCIIALPYGLGAGAVDAALNNYVALHYKASHMNWLHCFWGVGATAGPYIMGACLTRGLSWSSGYRTIGYIQIVLTAVLFITIGLWGNGQTGEHKDNHRKEIGMLGLLRMRGAKPALLSFFGYCALEQTAGLWAASYLVLNLGMGKEMAAKWASFFYLGITAGRMISGFLAARLKDHQMIRLGLGVAMIGILSLMLPLPKTVICVGLILIGVGCAPIYPCLLHETPQNFGEEYSQAIMGMQMATAYVGITVMPPIFGLLVNVVGIGFYPVYMLVILGTMIFGIERLHKSTV